MVNTGYKSRVEYTVTDALKVTYTFPFSYLRKKFVAVSILHKNNTKTSLTYEVDYTVNDFSITLTTPASVGEHIIIYRQTSTDKIITWNDGSILQASDMNIDKMQMLHLQEEQQDYIKSNALANIVTDYAEIVWDALNQRIINVRDPQDAQNVVTKHYMENVQDGFVASNTKILNDAKATLSATQQTQSKAQSNETLSKAWATSTESPDSAEDTQSSTGKTQSSRSWSLYSKEKAQEAATSEAHAKTSETNANTSETNAKTSETNAKASETNAKTSETKALTSEIHAKTSETNAKTSETNAKTSETKALASEHNAKTSETNAFLSENGARSHKQSAQYWAESGGSPDGVVDTDSPTGYTQSAKIWAALSKEYAGLSKFKLPIGYYNSVNEMRKSETAFVGRPCVTLGFMAKGDGRGAKYVVREPKDTDVYDDYSVVKLDNGSVAELLELSQDYEDDVKIIFPLYGDAEHPPVEETNGDCVLVGRKNHWFMIDTYLCENNYVMIQRTMKAHNIKTLDFVLITHYHGDHYGNLERLLKDTAVSVKKVLLPRTTSQPDLAPSVTSAQTKCIKWCSDNNVAYEIADNQVFDFYGATVKIFNASAEDYAYYENLNDKEYNDYSVCMLLSFMGRTALFTGDTQKIAKEKIVTDGIIAKPVDLVKSAHHANGPLVLPLARRLSPNFYVATQSQKMSSISAGWSALTLYKKMGADVHVVGWQAEDLIYSVSKGRVVLTSGGILSMDPRGLELIDIYVDASISRGTFCDGSKEHPYNDIQDALDNCAHSGIQGANIYVADGDYTSNNFAGYTNRIQLNCLENVSIIHDGDASKALLPTIYIVNSKNIQLKNITTTTKTAGEVNLNVDRSECYVYSCVFSTTLQAGTAVSVRSWNSSVLRIESTTISNMYKALYAAENSQIIVAGDMYGTGNSYTYSTQNGGEILIAQNGFVEQVNRYYSYVKENPGIGQYIYSPVWKTEPTIFTWRGTKIKNVGDDKGDIFIDYYRSISNTEKKYKKSYDNIIENSISEAPLYVGQIAVVNGVGYIATGTTTASDWKKITN